MLDYNMCLREISLKVINMFPLPAHRFHNVSNQRQETRTYNNGSNTVTTRRMNHVYERTSSASNCEVLTNRGFKPSDRRDPQKREFLINLSKKICHLDDNLNPVPRSQLDRCRSMNSLLSPDYNRNEYNFEPTPKPINIKKIFTPADDFNEHERRQTGRKAFASSQFYNPGLHPTKEDQVKLAQQISSSLSDVSNKKSKGQTMYLNRKQRSVKWVHEGQGKAKVDEREYYETSHQNNMGEVQREFSHNKQSYTVPATNFNGATPFGKNFNNDYAISYPSPKQDFKPSSAPNFWTPKSPISYEPPVFTPSPIYSSPKKTLPPYRNSSQYSVPTPPPSKTFNLLKCNDFNRTPKGWFGHSNYCRPQFI